MDAVNTPSAAGNLAGLPPPLAAGHVAVDMSGAGDAGGEVLRDEAPSANAHAAHAAPNDGADADAAETLAIGPYCCSSRCIQQVGTTFGSVLIVIGVVAIVFGALTISSPTGAGLVAGGALLTIAGIAVIYLSQKYVGMDVELARMRAQNNAFQRENAQFRADLAEQQRLLAAEREATASLRQTASSLRDAEASATQLNASLRDTLEQERTAAAAAREASARELEEFKAAHATVVRGLTDAINASAAEHRASLAGSSAAVTGAATTVTTAATKVDTAAARILEAAAQLATNSAAYLALQAENQQLRARLSATSGAAPSTPPNIAAVRA